MIVGALTAALGGWYLYDTYGKDMPSYDALVNYQPPTITRIHASDGQLIGEYSTERRLFVPISAVPDRVRAAFVSAEDKLFWSHSGVDWISLAGAVPNNIRRISAGRRPAGASTITMQVSKNFITGRGSTRREQVERKFREIFIAMDMETKIDKEEILELYLNKIYFGFGAYGIASAALTIFNKSVSDLETHEAAYLAAAINGPGYYHPERNKERALDRRNWIIGQMQKNGYLNSQEAEEAKAKPLGAKIGAYSRGIAKADYFAEEVRKQLVRDYSLSAVNEGGLSVRATIDLKMQGHADSALRNGLLAYDKRHGWRGPLARLNLETPSWPIELDKIPQPAGSEDWGKAVVLDVEQERALASLPNGAKGIITLEESKWAAEALPQAKVGKQPNAMSDILKAGDVILVEYGIENADGFYQLKLQQIPEVNGGLIVMDPHTGRVLAQAGGWSYTASQFNRATQALRQTGSSIKPFVYLAALDSGYSPRSELLDSPVVIEQVDGTLWRPENYDERFSGLQPFRIGLENSRNLMTVRLAQAIGMDTVKSYATRFGVGENFPPYLSSALGANSSTLLNMARAYSQIVNGGKRIDPTMIDRVQDRKGKTLYRHDERPFDDLHCKEDCLNQDWKQLGMPVVLDDRTAIADPVSLYQLISLLRGVVERGTAARSVGAKLNRPVAGKTGTTNNYQDAWFVGFTPDLVVATYIGFDEGGRTLGKDEGGGSAAAPIFSDFIANALANKPPQEFRIPKGVVFQNIAQNGLFIDSSSNRVEAVREDRETYITDDNDALIY